MWNPIELTVLQSHCATHLSWTELELSKTESGNKNDEYQEVGIKWTWH